MHWPGSPTPTAAPSAEAAHNPENKVEPPHERDRPERVGDFRYSRLPPRPAQSRQPNPSATRTAKDGPKSVVPVVVDSFLNRYVAPATVRYR